VISNVFKNGDLKPSPTDDELPQGAVEFPVALCQNDDVNSHVF